jgi:alkanesulfonate monooxygenase
MSVESIGMIATQDRSETRQPTGLAIDPAYVARAAQAHEAAGFDRILVAHNSHDADAVLVASQAAAATSCNAL